MRKIFVGSTAASVLAVIMILSSSMARTSNRASTQPWPTPDPASMVLPNDPQPYANFGAALAASGDYLAVGAPGADLEGIRNAGVVYLFRKRGPAWEQVARLTPDPAQEDSRFGSVLAMDKDVLTVGAPYAYNPGAGNASGAVYIFTRRGRNWELNSRLSVEGGRPFDLFGSALALQGDDLAVGSRGFDGPAGQRDAGAVYLYHQEGGFWRLDTRIGGEAAAFDHFGHAVAFAGEQLLVSSPDAAVSKIARAGQVSVFQRIRGDWSGPTRLTASQPRSGSRFGFGLDVLGDQLAVVSPQEYQKPGEPPPNALAYESAFGVAHIFSRKGNVWEWQARLIPQPANEQQAIRVLRAVFVPETKPAKVMVSGFGPSVLFPFVFGEEGWQGFPALDLPVFVLNEGLVLVQTPNQTLIGSRLYDIPQPDGNSLQSAGAVWIFNP